MGLALASLPVPWAQASADEPEPTVVRVGVLAFDLPAETLAQWAPTMADLEQAVPGHRFVLQVINYPDLTRALSEAFLGESISEAYPDARHIANQETGIAAGAFLERCPYRSREILDESFWPGEPKSFSESVA